MRVIKNGKEKTFIMRCSSCGSDLEYTLEDVHKKEIEMGYIKYITCPVCGEELLYALLETEDDRKQTADDSWMYSCSQY